MPERRSIKIRQADAYDAVNLLRLAEAGIKENVVNYPDFDPTVALGWASAVIAQGAVFVADLDGRIVGSLGLELNSYPWSRAQHLQTAWFYVIPNFRQHGTAENLMRAAEAFVDKHGVRLHIELAGGVDADLKDRWMTKRGYQYAGGCFTRAPRGIVGQQSSGAAG